RFFIVSDLELVKNNGLKQEVSQVKVLKDEGIKCERCWNRYPANKVNAEHLCERCEKAFKKAAQHE
ncbi:MAG: hypothetical protein PHY11_04330, partial [Bacilli bacterium]|nr:hypothetical protein [Bacilli bacterium]